MNKQTAMQSLLVLLEMAGSRAEMVHVESLIGTIKASYINLEKEQIKDAWYNGGVNGMGLFETNTGEEYYDKKFNQKEETLEEWKAKFTHHCAIKTTKNK